MRDALLRYLYAPLFQYWPDRAGDLSGGRLAPGAVCLPILLLLAVGISTLAEAQVPYQSEWNQPRLDAWRDRWHAVINETLNSLGVSRPLPGGH